MIERMNPKKRLGQHFLRDEGYLDQIVQALDPSSGEVVVEIGAGRGALTAKLLQAGLRVESIEFDRDLVHELQARFAGNERFHLVSGDARRMDYTLFGNSFKVVGNLPYQSATVITRRLMTYIDRITVMVLTFQKEVAERITARPGSRDYGYLSCLAQYHCLTEYIATIPPGAFWPAPKVRSGVARLFPRRDKPVLSRGEEKELFNFIKKAFAHRRKTIVNTLWVSASGNACRDVLKTRLLLAGLDPSFRPERFSLEEFMVMKSIVDSLGKNMAPGNPMEISHEAS